MKTVPLETIAYRLYQDVPLGLSTYGKMVPWDQLDDKVKRRWMDYADKAVDYILSLKEGR